MNDEAGFRRSAATLLETRGGDYERSALEYVRFCFEPLFASPFRVTRSYVTEVVQHVYQMKRHVIGGDDSFTALPVGMVFMNRLQFGFYSVLARLDARADYKAVEDRIFSEAGL